jgi:hypothetical protein
VTAAAGARPARGLLAGLAALLVACGGDVAVRPQVLTPPPSAPRPAFFVEKAEVQSREVGNEAWQRNEDYGRELAEALREALRARGKTLSAPPADIVRAKVYLAHGKAPVKSPGTPRAGAYVEVRLELLDHTGGTTLYTTHTLTPIPGRRFGLGPEPDEVIRRVLAEAARDFASRL